MINGALNFTLGLQANQFLNALQVSSGKLLAFTGVANGIRAAFGKMWDAVQQGGKLTDLASAASISVKQLYQLQFAFEQIGASADGVNSVILRMRANLAGGSQDELLKQIGLDPATLRAGDVVTQFESIAAAMARLDATSSAGAAQKIFGREGAQVAQIIANSGTAFADAMKQAADDAQVWQNVAPAFDAIADKVTALQRHLQTIWATLAGALVQAFHEGRIGEVLNDILTTSIQAAFDALPQLAIGGLVKIGEVLLRIIHEAWAQAQTLFDYMAEKLTLGSANWGELLQANRDTAWNFFGASLDDISGFANSQLQAGFGAGAAAFADLNERLKEFTSRLPQGSPGAVGVAAAGGRAEKTLQSDFTDIEKMGGVLLGLGRGFGGDEARQTARNTAKTADILGQHSKILHDTFTALKSIGLVNT